MSETSVVTELLDTEILELKWSDLSCFGCYWEKNPDMPVLIIRVQPANSSLQELVCYWAANLKMVMEYQKNCGGPLLTREVVFSKQMDNRWKVVFECLSDGYIGFECSSLGLRDV